MKNKLSLASKIFGIIVTLFMLLAFGPKFIESINNEGITFLKEIPNAFVNWYDNPTAFFFTYFLGYIIIWWRKLLGVIIILLGDILFFVFNIENIGVFIFIIPTFLVALLYYLHWNTLKKS
jgi:hypothetical protein